MLGGRKEARRHRTGKEFPTCLGLRETKGDQPCEVLGRVAIGSFSETEVRVMSWD